MDGPKISQYSFSILPIFYKDEAAWLPLIYPGIEEMTVALRMI
jgi:hypothetical protein